MLDRMRTHTQNWLIYLMFGAIILVFAINFGPGFDQLSQSGCGRGASTAAVVNGTIIPRRLYDMQWRSFVQFRRIPRQMQGMFKGQILDQLVDLHLIAQEAQRYGIRISEDEIDDELLKDASFQRNGVFDKGYFRAIISRFRLTAREYKEYLRIKLQAQRMQELLSAGVSLSMEEVKNDYINKNTKVKIEYVALNAGKLQKSFKVTSTEAEAFIKKEDKRLKKYYDANLDRFTKKAKVRTRHLILTFKVRGKPTTAELNTLKDKIEALRKQAIKKPKQFGLLVRKHSQEPGASKSGGLLPYIEEGAKGWDPAYVKGAFALKKKDEISPVVKSSFGYHLIQLVERQEADKRPLSKRSVKLEIARILLQRDKAASFIQQQAKAIIDQAKKSKSLKEAIKVLKAANKPAARKPAPVVRRAAPAPRRAAPAARKPAAPPARTKPAMIEAFAPAARRPAPAARKPVAARKPAAPVARKPVARKPAVKAGRVDSLVRSLLMKQQLKAKVTPPFPLDAESIPGIKKVVGAPIYPLVRAAFALTQKKPWSDKAIKVLDKVYIIRLKKRVTPNMKKFEKQKTNYFKQMLTRRQREFQEAWLKQLRKRAKIEKNMKAIMSKRF